jgi:hypothetical protein
MQATSQDYDGAEFDADAARSRWIAVDSERRRQIIESAKIGVKSPDEELVGAALGWAWVILGPPWKRREPKWYEYALMIIMSGGQSGMAYWVRMNGSKEYDLQPIVRKAARIIEKLYYKGS